MLYIVCICSCKRIDALRDVAGKSDVRSAKRLYESQLLRCQILKLVNQRRRSGFYKAQPLYDRAATTAQP